jgi:tRNA(fMet)-specific endonuclease VapC
MKRYVLDTGIAADFVFRRGHVFDVVHQRTLAGGVVGIALPTLGELFAGVEYSQTREANLKKLLRNLPRLTLWPFDRNAAEEFGKIFAGLRRVGRPIQQIDMQIAAITVCLGNSVLVTKDSDFSAIPGLNLEDWSKPAYSPKRSILIPTTNQLLLHSIRLPGDRGDDAADVEGGDRAGELAVADDDDVAGGGIFDGESAIDHLGVVFEEGHRVLR